MIDLAHNLAKSDTKFFEGWVLAGATAHIYGGQADSWENTVVLSKERKSILRVIGKDKQGNIVKQLDVILVLPKGHFSAAKPQTAQKPAVPITDKENLVAQHVFTEAEIVSYIERSGDENIIHKGPDAVVPGLCMAVWLQKALHLETLAWRFSFLAPVYIGDPLAVYQTDKGMEAYVGSVKVFTIRK